MPVEANGKYGFADYTGRHVIPCQYDTVHMFMAGLAAAKSGGKWGYLDKTGELVIPCQWESATNFVDGSAWVELTPDYWRLIDRTGKYIE